MYTDIIHDSLWIKLQASGMPAPVIHDLIWGDITTTPNYAQVFDWFIQTHNIYITIEPSYDFASELVVKDCFDWNVSMPGKTIHHLPNGVNTEFNLAAENAIKAAIKAAIKYINK